MRKALGLVLVGIGAFLLAAAVMGRFWAPGHAERTPLDVNTATRLTGEAQKLNAGTGKLDDLSVKATSLTRADSKHSDDDVVAFVATTCLLVDKGNPPDCVDAKDPQARLIDASTDTFATDRHTAQAVDGKKYVAAESVPHEGLVNKWPFDAQKKTYPYWDGVLGTTVPATYDGSEKVDGLATYRYKVDVPATSAEVLADTQGKYTSQQTIWVEPRTGAIVKQTQASTRTLDSGQKILDLDLTYTPKTVSSAVADAKTNVSSLRTLTVIVPLVGLIAGLLLIAAGLFITLTGRRRTGAHVETTPESGGSHRVSLA